MSGIGVDGVVHDHRRVGRLGHQLVLDHGAAVELPHRAAARHSLDVNIEHAARHHRATKPGVVDAGEVNKLAAGEIANRIDDEHRGGLRHRLDDEDAGHHRPTREMTLEIVFLQSDVLDTGGADPAHYIHDLIDH